MLGDSGLFLNFTERSIKAYSTWSTTNECKHSIAVWCLVNSVAYSNLQCSLTWRCSFFVREIVLAAACTGSWSN